MTFVIGSTLLLMIGTLIMLVVRTLESEWV